MRSLVLLLALGMAACQSPALVDSPARRALDATAPTPVTSSPAPHDRVVDTAIVAPCSPTRTWPRGEIYASLSVSAIPAVGAGVELGQVFSRRPNVTWSFEMRAAVQNLDWNLVDVDEGGSRVWPQVQGGVKALFRPCGRGHPVARAGVVWLRAQEDNELIDQGDYVGLYVGVGYEWDISRSFSTGPEVSVNLLTEEGNVDKGVPVIPQITWRLIWNL